jgi:Wzt-like putative exopolysaccharide export protein
VAEVTLRDANGKVTPDFEYGDSLDVQVHCRARRDARDVQLTLTVRGDYGPLFSASSDVYPLWRVGKHEVDCRFEKLPLLPGLYRIEVTLAHAAVAQWSLPHEVAAFRVITDLAEYGSDSVVGATKSRGGFLAVPYDWRIRSAIGEQLLPGLRLPRNMAASRPR